MSRQDLAFREYAGGSSWPSASPSSYYKISNTAELDLLFQGDGDVGNETILCIWFDMRGLPDPFGYFLSSGPIGSGLNVWTNPDGAISINDSSTTAGSYVVLNRGPHMYMFARDRTSNWSGRRHRIYDARGNMVEQIDIGTGSEISAFPHNIGRRADGNADRYAQDTICSNMFLLQAGQGAGGDFAEYDRFLNEIARRSAAGLNPAGVSGGGYCETLLYLPLCGTLEDISGNGHHLTHHNIGSVGLRHDTSHVAPPSRGQSQDYLHIAASSITTTDELQTVAKDVTLLSRLLQEARRDLTTLTKLLQLAAGDTTLTTSLLQAAAGDTTLTTSLLQAAAGDTTLTTSLLQAAAGDTTLGIGALQNAESEVTLLVRLLAVVETVARDVELRWSQSAWVAGEADLRWQKLQGVSEAVTAIWQQLQPIESSRQIRLELLQSAVKGVELRWRLLSGFAEVFGQIDLRWHLIGQVHKSLQLNTQLLQSVGIPVALHWEILEAVERHVQLQFSSLEAANVDVVTSWSLVGNVGGAIEFRWFVGGVPPIPTIRALRLYVVERENRVLGIQAESRTFRVSQENRSWIVE